LFKTAASSTVFFFDFNVFLPIGQLVTVFALNSFEKWQVLIVPETVSTNWIRVGKALGHLGVVWVRIVFIQYKIKEDVQQIMNRRRTHSDLSNRK
jgi:hypothetical protein